jgi:hypothetical protein
MKLLYVATWIRFDISFTNEPAGQLHLGSGALGCSNIPIENFLLESIGWVVNSRDYNRNQILYDVLLRWM